MLRDELTIEVRLFLKVLLKIADDSGSHWFTLVHIGSHCILHLLQMLIRKFKENPGLKSNLSERAVVLDPDLIDLTMIPPPMTPDEVSKIF